MFIVAPIKHKVDYARFDLANPPLNLTLEYCPNVHTGGALSHLGLQVESSIDARAAVNRFVEAGRQG